MLLTILTHHNERLSLIFFRGQQDRSLISLQVDNPVTEPTILDFLQDVPHQDGKIVGQTSPELAVSLAFALSPLKVLIFCRQEELVKVKNLTNM